MRERAEHAVSVRPQHAWCLLDEYAEPVDDHLIAAVAGKVETRRFADASEARREIFRWIDFYDHRRRHSN